jgi:uncharacterized pyridoxamine 5'-phosphate oxidase family protein/Pyruvate/2-oxoacid:ferredoxin oxidoreductase delta subunit
MDQITEKALKILRQIKSITFATTTQNSPSARIIDVMMVKEDGLYFLTARGKSFFQQLKTDHKVAICGMNRQYTAVRIEGEIRFCNNPDIIDQIFQHNPVMTRLYPGEKKDILEGFHLFRGKGEIFDLSSAPPVRQRFAFGGETVNPPGYHINDDCTGCGVCIDACPVDIISEAEIFKIDRRHCLECGRCAEICPEGAVEPALGI